MIKTISNTVSTDTIDTISSASTLQLGILNANEILIGSALTTPQIVIDTLSTLNTNANPAIAIGTSSSAKTIKINNSTNSVHLSGLDIKGTGLNNITATSGQVDIAQLQTSGDLNIATNASRTSNINVGSVTNTGAISLQTASTLNTDGSPAISIGTSGSVKTLKIGSSSVAQTVNIAGVSNAFNGTTQHRINPITSSNNLYIGSTQDSGLLFLGAGDSVVRSGNIQISTTNNSTNTVNIKTGNSTTGDVNILNGLTSGGSVNIASGSGASQTTAVTISTGSTTGLVSIGNSATTTRILSPLTYASTIGASYSSLPSRAVTDIGYIYTGSAFNSTTPASGSTVSTITISTAGVYTISFAYYISATAKPTELYCVMSGGELFGTIYGNTNINATNSMVFGTQIFKQDSVTSTPYNLVMSRTGGTALTTTVASCYFKAVKIA
jgi:hypothetical protein